MHPVVGAVERHEAGEREECEQELAPRAERALSHGGEEREPRHDEHDPGQVVHELQDGIDHGRVAIERAPGDRREVEVVEDGREVAEQVLTERRVLAHERPERGPAEVGEVSSAVERGQDRLVHQRRTEPGGDDRRTDRGEDQCPPCREGGENTRRAGTLRSPDDESDGEGRRRREPQVLLRQDARRAHGAAERHQHQAPARERLAHDPGRGEGERQGEGRVAEDLPVGIRPDPVDEEERHDGQRAPTPARPPRDQIDDAGSEREEEDGEYASRLDRGAGHREGRSGQVEDSGKRVVDGLRVETVPLGDVGGDLQDRPLVDETHGAEAERELQHQNARHDRERDETVTPPPH